VSVTGSLSASPSLTTTVFTPRLFLQLHTFACYTKETTTLDCNLNKRKEKGIGCGDESCATQLNVRSAYKTTASL